MTIKTRRLLAATLTSALVAAPALVCSGPAHASTAASANVLGAATGLLGGGSVSTTSVNLVGSLLNDVISTLSNTTSGTGGTSGGGSGTGTSGGGSGTGTTDPVGALTGTLTTVLTGAGDPQTMVADLAAQLAGQLDGVTGGQELIDALTSGDPQETISSLVSVLPLDSIFPDGFSPDLRALLSDTSNPAPDNTDELIAAMTEYYEKQNMSDAEVKKDATAKGIPASVLQALLLALSKRSTAPKPPATGPTAACIKATKNVTKLKKQVKVAKLKHQKAKAKRLAKKLTKARIAKIRAC